MAVSSDTGSKGSKSNSSFDDFDNPYVRIAYMCKICGKEQSKKFKFDWKRHYLTHGTVPKNIVCKICGKAYNQQGQLNKHMRTHAQNQFQQSSHQFDVKPIKFEYD